MTNGMFMKKIFAAALLCTLMATKAFAGGFELITLLDLQTSESTSVLVGASDEQKAKYFPDGKIYGPILAREDQGQRDRV